MLAKAYFGGSSRSRVSMLRLQQQTPEGASLNAAQVAGSAANPDLLCGGLTPMLSGCMTQGCTRIASLRGTSAYDFAHTACSSDPTQWACLLLRKLHADLAKLSACLQLCLMLNRLLVKQLAVCQAWRMLGIMIHHSPQCLHVLLLCSHYAQQHDGRCHDSHAD